MARVRIRFRWTSHKLHEREFPSPNQLDAWLDPMLAKPEIISIEDMMPMADGTPRWVPRGEAAV
ncbi:MAG: hypothetical protein ACREBC_29955 [Pyrinomonadaceae bacterium]